MFEKLRNIKHLDLIFNSISDMVFLISVEDDGSFRYVTVNQKAIELLHYPTNYSGKKVEDLMPSSSAKTIVEKYQEAIETKDSLIYESRLAFPEDTDKKFWVESKVTPIFDDEGNCEHIIAVTSDITERKQREKELRRTKEELEQLFHHVADAVFSFDENGDYLTVNPSFINMFGWTMEELQSDPNASILTPKEQEEFESILRRLKQGEVIEAHQSEHKTKQRKTIRVLSSYAPIMEDGEMKGGIAVYKDVANIEKLRDQLTEAENRYRLIVENSNDLIRIIDKNGKIEYASPSHKQILDIEPSFFLGKSFLSFVHLEDMAAVENFFTQIMESKEAREIDYRRLNKNGEFIWVHAKAGPVVNAKGEVEQVVIVSRDITERKEKEQELATMALFDELTGLPNRTFFEQQVEIAMNLSNRKGNITGLFILDCDDFKSLNDMYGHDVGDEVLKEFAERIRGCVRNTDTVSRMGGDEFQIVLPELEEKGDARSIAQRILNKMDEPMTIGDRKLSITTSIGISYYSSTDKTRDALMKEADQALYESKKKGKNAYSEYTEMNAFPTPKQGLKRLFQRK
ncbi:sensor domain-containing protein [Salinibacillus xinjiangensis]|uniref:PAS domain S-box protein n=1 Tax=Salinibacillus xinjiangensis TaxID=1229268 RepID=A0A6G1X427_9BACI|nr:PAS domain S-box protein [Salinibacillus xinjiangensis]MRG85714.1 PAS domain S-box protein [Salinibacillus xinjiangensis]